MKCGPRRYQMQLRTPRFVVYWAVRVLQAPCFVCTDASLAQVIKTRMPRRSDPAGDGGYDHSPVQCQ
jgi:hypothetical protein